MTHGRGLRIKLNNDEDEPLHLRGRERVAAPRARQFLDDVQEARRRGIEKRARVCVRACMYMCLWVCV